MNEEEITRLLGILIGETEAIGVSEIDHKREANLKTLIDVTNWCLDRIHQSAFTRHNLEGSMRDIGERAFTSLTEFWEWLDEVIKQD